MSDMANSLPLSEFLDMFSGKPLGEIKVSFKKRICHFLLDNYMPMHNKLYYPIWGSWMVLIVISMLFHIKSPTYLFLKDFIGWVVLSSIVPLSASIILMRRVIKYRRKKGLDRLREIYPAVDERMDNYMVAMNVNRDEAYDMIVQRVIAVLTERLAEEAQNREHNVQRNEDETNN